MSDEPVLVWQIFGWDRGGAATVHLAPTERWSKDEALWVFGAPNSTQGIAVVCDRSSKEDVRLDGEAIAFLPQTIEFPVDGEHTVLVTPAGSGSHRLTSPDPVLPVVYGHALRGFNAYAYTTVW